MLVIPSIDLMEGKVVRLIGGDPRHAKFYDHIGDPIAVARMWESMGASLIHVVDLDAAFGRGDNVRIISEMVREVNVPLQVGGGIRSIERARQLVGLGASRIIIGSMAFRDLETFKTLLREMGPERIVVALDHSMGMVMIDGWREGTGMELRRAAKMFIDMGVSFFLVTSIRSDGALTGPDIENLRKILDLNANIIASGGIRCLNDIAVLKDLGLYGVIIGRALYEGHIDLKEALKIASK